MKELESHVKWKLTNKNWKIVLDEIVNYAPNKYGRGKTGYGDDHPLAKAKNLNITGYELMMIMSFLEEQGLIEYDKSENNWINVSSKGFDVALQNQSADKANRKDKTTLFLSYVVALAVACSLLVGIENLIQKWVVAVVFAIAVLIGGYVIKRSF